jgi:hypothetical protein
VLAAALPWRRTWNEMATAELALAALGLGSLNRTGVPTGSLTTRFSGAWTAWHTRGEPSAFVVEQWTAL